MRRLGPDDWPLARDLRLRALAQDPAAFGSTAEREQALTREQWHDRLTGSAWLVPDGDDGLVVHRVEHGGHTLLSMWVAPEARGSGLASRLVEAVLERAAGAAVRLWVVRGNDAAARLYARHGFAPTGRTAPLPSDPSAVQVELERPAG